MNEFGNSALALIAAIIGLAIISVIIGQKSQAPQAIQAFGTEIATVVRAAVNPIATAATNGNPANGSFSTPSNSHNTSEKGNGINSDPTSFSNDSKIFFKAADFVAKAFVF